MTATTILSHPRRWVILALSGALLLTACPDNRSSSSTQRTEAPVSAAPLERRVKVRLLTPQLGELSSRRSASVTLEPRRSANVAAQASGQVARVLVAEGDKVSAGQTVLTLDDTGAQNGLSDARLALESARLNLRKAENAQSGNTAVTGDSVQAAQQNLALIERRLKESRELLAVGGIAAIDVQQLEANAAQARSSLRSAQDQAARAGRSTEEDIALLRVQVQQAQNRLENLQENLRDTEVRAPFAGIISDLAVQQGEFLANGSRAFVIADTSALEGKFRLPPEQAETLEDGQKLNLVYAGRAYTARLDRRTTVPGQDRQLELVVRLATRDIPIGATARLNYPLKLAQGFVLPSGAVRSDSAGQSTVFVSQGGKAVAEIVQVLGEAEGKVAVEGLEKNQRVVFPLPADVVGGETLEVVK